LLGAAALLAPALPPTAIDWQPGRFAAEPWRAWSAVAWHLSTMHLVVNLAGLALVAALGAFAALPARAVWAWLAAWPLTQIGLLLEPSLRHYGGLSGVLPAGAAVVATQLVLDGGRNGGRQRWLGAALLAGMCLKVLSEAPWGPALRHPPGWDIAVAPLAHATGLLAGIGCTLIAHALLHARRPTTALPAAHR
jgi:rhomboid family GlyGly-CTERM serine protease